MQKLVLTGIITFALGIAVGRFTVLAAKPEAPAPMSTVTAPVAGTVSGRVAEVLQVPQYTYLRLESGAWAAVASVPSLQAGQQVTVLVQTEMSDFTSPSLNRTFATIVFGTIDGAPQAPALPKSVTAAIDAARVPATTLRIEDIFAGRTELNGQRVRVKGTVDRVNAVQGMHYAHVKDGSGSSANKDDDLLCISAAPVEKGAQVTFEGTIGVERNVGMGVQPVVLDNAIAH
jgi:hypothetical protein